MNSLTHFFYSCTFLLLGSFTAYGAANDSLKAKVDSCITALEKRAELADNLLLEGQLIPLGLYDEFLLLTDSLSMLYTQMGSSIQEEKQVGQKMVKRAKWSKHMAETKWAIEYADQYRKGKMMPNLDR